MGATDIDENTLAGVVAAAEPTRLGILVPLGGRGRMCVGDIAARFKASRPAISHHFRVLRSCGLVKAEREGQEIHYSAAVKRVVETLRKLADSLEECCGRKHGGGPARK